MDLPVLTVADGVAIALAVIGVGLAAFAVRALSDSHRDAVLGHLVAVDAGRPATLRSDRYRLAGRPDSLRRGDDGRLIPVEVKSRRTPARGPTRSHLVQVRAYCLLVEETTGRPPPYGVLRYSDGEFRVRWDASARRELLALRSELLEPYDGRATPSPGKCSRCSWAGACDARSPPNEPAYLEYAQ